MNVQATNGSGAAPSAGNQNEVQRIEKQIQNLEKQRRKLIQEKNPDNAEKIKELEKRIQQLQERLAKLQQKNSEEANTEQVKQHEDADIQIKHSYDRVDFGAY